MGRPLNGYERELQSARESSQLASEAAARGDRQAMNRHHGDANLARFKARLME